MQTETQNPQTIDLDQLSSVDLVGTFVKEDKQVFAALEKAQAEIAKAVDLAYESLSKGGRIFYFGAGTSGRLGVLDASECPPTFSADPEMVQGIIAGGDEALRNAIEGAEDSEEDGYKFVQEKLKTDDLVIGITASGTTPFVIGTLKAAKDLQINSIAIANNPQAPIFDIASHKIFLDTGAEVIAGSTRLKAGSSQKMTLNIISSGAMVKLGKVYQNLMVDLQANNKKLVKRAIDLVIKITSCKEAEAKAALEKTEFKVKNAVLYILKELDYQQSKELLERNNGFLRKCLD